MKQQEDNKTIEIKFKTQPKTGSERQAALRKRYKGTWSSVTEKSVSSVPLEQLVLAASYAVRNKSMDQLGIICDELTKRCALAVGHSDDFDFS